MIIDFRSDTVTRPTPGMLEAMIKADVGDDVFGEDEAVNALEAFAAGMFGMEAGIFCASGTMTNQIAIKCHTQPADEVICESQSHIYQYEGGGIAFNSGCQVKLVDGNRGRITADEISAVVNPQDIHKAPSRLISLENTSNRGGGSCYDIREIEKIRELCNREKLQLHLDGARLFNALIARNETPEAYGRLFDSISICLSKGLGAPVGSVLLGKKEFIYKARRIRKILGGGMRQAGYLAAGGLYALQHHVSRLSEDHAHARQIAKTLQERDFVKSIMPVETNIIIFEVNPPYTALQLTQKLKERNMLVYAISPTRIRMVLHLDVTPAMVNTACAVVAGVEV
ncbi:GntG family PLP-dependent aldolase [Agriterribacter sp.]|uniref:threonine aldolase family protein n=1 Tax=Agriterribacter sp. TaxID=2821509 RepID=UPI002BCF89D1|nr:GntG family PLP-dependent aldolase [Agriterribacter sp.]HRO46253.1 GntG family PLP-dependent aldolase [Agriterribacter sp.]HRQ18414.1 GntG family PLP-dependent aldolase [Agriterribacter sp.]